MASSVCSGVKKCARNWPASGLSDGVNGGTAGSAGRYSAARKTCWPSGEVMKSTELGGVGMRRGLVHGDHRQRGGRRLHPDPVDRRALLGADHGVMVEDLQRD